MERMLFSCGISAVAGRPVVVCGILRHSMHGEPRRTGAFNLKNRLTYEGLEAFTSRLRDQTSAQVIRDMAAFMDRFRDFREGRAGELRYDAFVQRFREMMQSMNHVRSEARRMDRALASDFNVFEILGLQNYEVTTHSAFLGNLLSSHGSHAQEDLFFRTFVDTIVPRNRRAAFKILSPGDYTVGIETSIDTGYIDILIESRQRDHRFAIIIENKVLADDQPRQLARYYDYVTAQAGYRDDVVLLVYLTPGGWAPTAQSLAPYNRDHWLCSGLLVEVSYWEHVKAWMQQSLPQVKAPAVAAVLAQYIRTVERVGKG